MKQAIILAGGAGTRLRDRLGDLPKPMIPISGKPLLEHQVELCRRHGFTDLVFFVHYRADLIQQHFGDGAKWGVRIRYVVEREPLYQGQQRRNHTILSRSINTPWYYQRNAHILARPAALPRP